MEQLLTEIINQLKQGEAVSRAELEQLVKAANEGITNNEQHLSKKKLLNYFIEQRELNSTIYQNCQLDTETEQSLLALLQMRPGRTTSGVATITVITKPWICSSDCLYCPVDVRMPKSYLYSEPACQRAERNYFDPFLQVSSRLHTLTAMGHPTDKVELIVLGGTWSDYPAEYQIWFMTELFRALNLSANVDEETKLRHDLYEQAGISSNEKVLASQVETIQAEVYAGKTSFNGAIQAHYFDNPSWQTVSKQQTSTLNDLYAQHQQNEIAQHRCVGLVVETRPDLISMNSLKLLRQLGCTKIQMGVQSLDEKILILNHRQISLQQIQASFDLLRFFGFKTHAHIMVNLLGSSPDQDTAEYKEFVTNPHYIPDEIKLYPCSLVKGSKLSSKYDNKEWVPYTKKQLLDVLVADTLATPPYTRISRMIRDIGVDDILVGNKQSNLRQLVETEAGCEIQEMRYREIRDEEFVLADLKLDEIVYHTSNTTEYFLQYITADNKLVGFLRLSLPDKATVSEQLSYLPFLTDAAMIREVHIYGRSAKIDSTGENAQHLGLGKQLIQRAQIIARKQGYRHLNVISAVGTREYYRRLGFVNGELYQSMAL